jgi:hypothetical protein
MNSGVITEGKEISGGVGRMPTTPKPKITMVAQKQSSINKNWMEEDNIGEFFADKTLQQREQSLNEFVNKCMMAILVSCDGGRRLKKPGEAIRWYLDRCNEDYAEHIRKYLKPRHVQPWGEMGKSILTEIHGRHNFDCSEVQFKKDQEENFKKEKNGRRKQASRKI